MGKQKLFRVQAMNENGMMMDLEVMGRKAHNIAMQEAFGMCQAQGKGLVRSQMEHARGLCPAYSRQEQSPRLLTVGNFERKLQVITAR